MDQGKSLRSLGTGLDSVFDKPDIARRCLRGERCITESNGIDYRLCAPKAKVDYGVSLCPRKIPLPQPHFAETCLAGSVSLDGMVTWYLIQAEERFERAL